MDEQERWNVAVDARWLRYVDLYRGTLERDDFDEVLDCLRRRDLRQAEQHCKILLEQSGGMDASVWAIYGLYHMVRQDMEKAHSAIDRAVELDPDSTLTMNVAADFLSFVEDFERAEQLYLLSLQVDPDQLYPRMVLGNWYIAFQKYEDAVEVLLPLLQLQPENKEVWLMLHAATGLIPSTKKEEKIARSLLKQFPNQFHAVSMMATALLRQQRAKEALVYCKRATGLCPDDSLSWTMYGTVLNMLRKPKAALICHEQAVKCNKKDPKSWASLSVAYLVAGDIKRALEAADRVIALSPKEAIELVAHIEEWQAETARGESKRRSRKQKRRKRSYD
jgi:predicted Zn-dependent protease